MKVDEKTLISRAQKGDKEALNQLIKKYEAAIHKVCIDVSKPFISPVIDKDDLVQEAMVAFVKAVETFDYDKYNSLYYYSERCMKNRLFTILRKKNRIVPSARFEVKDDTADDTIDPYQNLLTKQRASAVSHILKDILSPLQLEVWSLYVQGYTYAEIAEELSIPQKKVDNTIMASKKKIAANMDKLNKA
ncbi:MAG TPA: sigma-70 family RNA polymerase sigma factor [Clostridia bacterium]|jgi:RNA polymerase sporulation-specific sigma factor|nr:sigma-70 family RNA polymerase sigma factor [Clostridia bacterium]